MAPSSDALCEIRSALTLRSAIGAGKKRAEHSFEATTPIQLPEAGRAIPPATKPTPATFATTDAPTRARGWLAAVFLGAAFPPSPPVADGLTAPVAWHAHQPRLATVDGSGRVLVHADPAGIDGRGADDDGGGGDGRRSPKKTAAPSVLRHSLHQGARALAWRPMAGATLAVAGAHGVCVWSHEPSECGGGGGAVSGVAGRGRIGGAPEWRLRHLREDAPLEDDDANDPYKAASTEGLKRVFAFVKRMVKVPSLATALATLSPASAFSSVSDGRGASRNQNKNARRGAVNMSKGASSSSSSSSSSQGLFDSPFGGGVPYDTLTWHPRGALLAAGSADRRYVAVWDVGTGRCARVSSGFAGVAKLLWSPCGGYLFASHPRGGFTVWETRGWSAAKWDTGGEDRRVTAAAWGRSGDGDGDGDAGGAVLLLAVSGGGGSLTAAHFPPSGAPSLLAQLLPVDLPRLTETTRDDGGAPARDDAGGGGGVDVADMTWDPSSSRLAVVLDASAPRRDDDGGAREPGRVVLYATTTRPVVRASLLGYVSAPGVRDVGMRLGVGGPARAVAMAGPGGGRGGGGGDGGEEASSTLAVCWEGGGVSVCPLYFPR